MPGQRGIQKAPRPAVDLAMDRYAEGEDAAFAQLYDLLGPRLQRYLCRRTGDPAAADDLLQQTFLQLHRARGHFAPGAAVVPWAFAIARRLFVDGVRRGRYEEAAAVERLWPLWSSEVEDEVHARQLALQAERKLETLPENQRTAFELVRGEGLSLAEAAEVLGTTTTAVKLRVFRASEALRALLRTPAGETGSES